jgi:hypothetical protein
MQDWYARLGYLWFSQKNRCYYSSHGNLTIYEGGKLILQNVTLVINSSYDGQYKIEVQTGGVLEAYYSLITAYNESCSYKFIVHGDVSLIKNEIRNLWGCLENYPYVGGIQIHSSNAVIKGNWIHHSKTHGICTLYPPAGRVFQIQ